MSHEIPEGAWEKIGADLFPYHDKGYLVTVYYKPNFWELDRLTDSQHQVVDCDQNDTVLYCTLWYPQAAGHR